MARSSRERTRLRPPGRWSIQSLRPTTGLAPTSAAVGGQKRLTYSSLQTAIGTTPALRRHRQTIEIFQGRRDVIAHQEEDDDISALESKAAEFGRARRVVARVVGYFDFWSSGRSPHPSPNQPGRRVVEGTFAAFFCSIQIYSLSKRLFFCHWK